MKIGLVGLPGAGKTTLFQLLTGVEAAAYSSGLEGTVGTARVPDRRVDYLSQLYQPKKTVYAQIDLTDLPGLNVSEQQQKGKNPFLTAVRNVDALVAVGRVFQEGPPHLLGEIDPRRDLEIIHSELLFSDWEIIEKRLERLEIKKKKENEAERDLLQRCREELENDGRLTNLTFTAAEEELLRGFQFLTLKPLLVVLNLDEEGFKSGFSGKEEFLAELEARGLPYLEVSAQIEQEIAELPPDDRALFMDDLGIKEPGIDRLARMVYQHLGLISFFTVGEDEVKAWTIDAGTVAKKAAGKIHSDIERGFIRAEVAAYDALREHGSMAKLREKGLLRLEGKDYVVQDGDIITFRFNV
ncbi:MAG: redox-regulated ATPase YchF [Firmicutes bacterium]|nr:redox-regulated ATPase YchF [Bacillota bacterium]